MKEKSKQTNEIENFLASQIIDEGQSHIPSGYQVVKNYPLQPPFSYANMWYRLRCKYGPLEVVTVMVSGFLLPHVEDSGAPI